MGRHVRAAGGVLWRRAGDQILVAVVHRPRYDDWSLPKGKLDKGEVAVVGALREVLEETGFRTIAGRRLGRSDYRVLDRGRDVPKTVRWWALQACDGEFVPGPEVDQLRWLDVPSAVALVSADRDTEPLRIFASRPPELTTVVAMRHASAGRRADWTGEDGDRPLDERGRRQAQAAAATLPAYAPSRLLAAPALRCQQTLQPLGRSLGLDVEIDLALSDAATPHLTGRLRSLSRSGNVVVCSQGEAVSAALHELGVTRQNPRKGSVWALSFDGDELVDADYTDDLRG